MKAQEKNNSVRNEDASYEDSRLKSELGEGISPFLNKAASIIEQQFPKYTGSVTLHIRDGKLASWESKAGGRYKE